LQRVKKQGVSFFQGARVFFLDEPVARPGNKWEGGSGLGKEQAVFVQGYYACKSRRVYLRVGGGKRIADALPEWPKNRVCATCPFE
jgi:hypothetical protein